jgi:hypothetical protein
MFMAYRAVVTPQQNSQVDDAKLTEQIKNTLDQVAGVQRDLANLRDNHVHTLDVKLNEQKDAMQNLALKVTELSTIINERIPKKQ